MRTGKTKTVLVTIVVTILSVALLGLIGTVAYYKAKNSSVEDENPPFFGSNPWSAECNAGDMEYDIENVELDYIVKYYYRERYFYDTDIIIATADVFATSYLVSDGFYTFICGSEIGKIENKKMGYRDPADDYLYYNMKITIPKETFALNYGMINITYGGHAFGESVFERLVSSSTEKYSDRNFSEGINAGTMLFYKADGKTVRFSDKEFETDEPIRFSERINKPISIGYERQINKENAVDFLEISADKSVFEKNDVKVNLSFGRLFDEAGEENPTVYLALFSNSLLYHKEGNGKDNANGEKDVQYYKEDSSATEESAYISRKIENYIPEKYACERILDENGDTSGIRFSHEETLILPEELFAGAGDDLYLCVRLYAEDPKVNPDTKLLAEINLAFHLCNGQVYLS